MKKNIAWRELTVLITIVTLFSLFSSALAAPTSAVTFTILHTNDFHGQLGASGSNPGMARTAYVIEQVRTTKGTNNVLLVDAGDEMQGSLLSNLQQGLPTIATFNAMSYDAATFGNHEFDWGQTVLGARTTQADYPYVTANIVQNNTGNCATAGWTSPTFADAPYQIIDVGSPVSVKVAFIGVTTAETPTITIASATAGLCFKDPADSIIYYYDAMKAAGADVIVVLSHLGNVDGGYGYGIPVYGDQTLATKLNTAGKPVNLIIGGHSHTDLAAAQTVGTTKVVQAHYNGRKVGQADITVGTDGSVTVNWTRLTVSTTGAEDVTIKSVIDTYATDPAYLAIVNEPVGYSAVDLPRLGGNADNMMGTFIDDAIYNYLNSDADLTNDVDIFFNNAGGIRTDWCYVSGVWVNTGCVGGLHDSALLTYGNMFTVLPFGNATVVGKMTGAQILEVVNYGPNVAGVIQPAGLKYSYYKYTDANPGPQPYAWGAYDVCVVNKVSPACEPLDLKATYNVGTNEFLAPAGGDGYNAFKYMTNITYWGDMLNAVNAYVTANYGTPGTAYTGPNGNGTLDGRIGLNGDGDTTFDADEIIPLTILHHNDSHGNLAKGAYVGYTQLATLIKQERLHNPNRTLLLNAGDSIQGDAMMYYFKDAGAGLATDGTVLPIALQINPFISVMNSMNYTAMTLGNHEFNFGSKVFVDTFAQANFPILGANLTDTGAYGINKVSALSTLSGTPLINVRDSISLTLPSGNAVPLKVAILGITNHRVPNYELPSNIPGLAFSNPLLKAAELVPGLRAHNDVVIAMTHIGFTENTSSVEVDANVDTNLAATVNGIDAIIGAHSHTDPSKQTAYSGSYKYLPSIVAAPNGKPVSITQAYRYNNTLGEEVIGLRSNGSGGYDVVSETGRYLSVQMSTAEDAATKAIVDPYAAILATYNNKVIGQTTVAIDALQAFTQETNGANLQADAAVYELTSVHGIPVDFHLSGAMTNKAVATVVPYPVTLTISNMFTLMPYENSLVVISMNGPQLKTVLERGYRNYYYYKYVPLYGGYSYYTTCMLDTNSGNKITYYDANPTLPNRDNVKSLTIGGVPVDFNNATKYYNVSTVNYLAAGSCNFNDGGVTLWPLNQIVADTQYYVRDSVIDYITHEGTVSPAIENRLNFITTILAVSEVDLLHSTDAATLEATATALPGSLASGFTMVLDPAVPWYYFDTDTISSNRSLADGSYPFYLQGSTTEVFTLEVNGTDYFLRDTYANDGTPLRVQGSFALGTYTYVGEVEDVYGFTDEVSLTITFVNDLAVTDADLKAGTVAGGPYTALAGSFADGFVMVLDPTVPWYYLDTDMITTNNTLKDGSYPFYLSGGSTTDPIFYVKVVGTTYTLIDAYQGDPNPLRINGDFIPGTYTYTGELTDVYGNKAPVSIEITFNDIPVVADQNLSMNEDATLGITLSAVDLYPGTLTWVLNTQPAHGTAVLAGNVVTYTPALNYNGPDSFTYMANDGLADSNVATVTITITPVKDDPMAVDDFYETNQNTILTVAAPGVMMNDTDVDLNSMAVTLQSGVSHGVLTLMGDGSFTYMPNPGFVGTDTFVYQLVTFPKANSINAAWTDEATVTITVKEVVKPMFFLYLPLILK